MRIRTEINQKKNVRVHIVSGIFDINTLYRTLVEMYNKFKFSADMNVLWDFRATEEIAKVSLSELNKIITLVGRKWGKQGVSRAALVVSRRVDFGLARLYEQSVEVQSNSKIKVFTDIKKAVSWIDQSSF